LIYAIWILSFYPTDIWTIHGAWNTCLNSTQKTKKKPVLAAHPYLFEPKKFKNQNVGIKFSTAALKKYFDVKLSKTPIRLTKNIIFLGEIPRTNNFENNVIEDDALLDDTALAYKGKNGLVIVTGCSHAGIANISEYAKKILKTKKIEKIIGGLHLTGEMKNKLNKTLKYLQYQKLNKLYPCHCTDLQAKMKLAKNIDVEEIGSGVILEFK